ncbi:MAG: hypothetical protein ACI36X_09715 [Bacteroidaceae bacterium]
MNKKPYIAPKMEQIEMELADVMAVSGQESNITIDTGGSQSEVTNPRSPRRFWSSADDWDIDQ